MGKSSRSGKGERVMWTSRAAVLRRTGVPMTIETLEVGPLASGDVLVRVRAASLCHTDLEAIDGALAVRLPAVLGHGAGGEIAAEAAGERAFSPVGRGGAAQRSGRLARRGRGQ